MTRDERNSWRVPGWSHGGKPKKWRSLVLFRLKVEMKHCLGQALTHTDPLWRARYLERHFIYVDAYIAVKEQAA